MSSTYDDNRNVITRIRGIASPIAFLPNCDIIRNENQYTSRDTARNSLFIVENGIPLLPIGSLVPTLAFEPNDNVTSAIFSYQAKKGIRLGSPYIRITNIERVNQNTPNVQQYRLTIADSRLSEREITFTVVSSEYGWLMNQSMMK